MGAGIKVGLGRVVEWSSLPQSWRQSSSLRTQRAGLVVPGPSARRGTVPLRRRLLRTLELRLREPLEAPPPQPFLASLLLAGSAPCLLVLRPLRPSPTSAPISRFQS